MKKKNNNIKFNFKNKNNNLRINNNDKNYKTKKFMSNRILDTNFYQKKSVKNFDKKWYKNKNFNRWKFKSSLKLKKLRSKCYFYDLYFRYFTKKAGIFVPTEISRYKTVLLSFYMFNVCSLYFNKKTLYVFPLSLFYKNLYYVFMYRKVFLYLKKYKFNEKNNFLSNLFNVQIFNEIQLQNLKKILVKLTRFKIIEAWHKKEYRFLPKNERQQLVKNYFKLKGRQKYLKNRILNILNKCKVQVVRLRRIFLRLFLSGKYFYIQFRNLRKSGGKLVLFYAIIQRIIFINRKELRRLLTELFLFCNLHRKIQKHKFKLDYKIQRLAFGPIKSRWADFKIRKSRRYVQWTREYYFSRKPSDDKKYDFFSRFLYKSRKIFLKEVLLSKLGLYEKGVNFVFYYNLWGFFLSLDGSLNYYYYVKFLHSQELWRKDLFCDFNENYFEFLKFFLQSLFFNVINRITINIENDYLFFYTFLNKNILFRRSFFISSVTYIYDSLPIYVFSNFFEYSSYKINIKELVYLASFYYFYTWYKQRFYYTIKLVFRFSEVFKYKIDSLILTEQREEGDVDKYHILFTSKFNNRIIKGILVNNFLSNLFIKARFTLNELVKWSIICRLRLKENIVFLKRKWFYYTLYTFRPRGLYRIRKILRTTRLRIRKLLKISDRNSSFVKRKFLFFYKKLKKFSSKKKSKLNLYLMFNKVFVQVISKFLKFFFFNLLLVVVSLFFEPLFNKSSIPDMFLLPFKGKKSRLILRGFLLNYFKNPNSSFQIKYIISIQGIFYNMITGHYYFLYESGLKVDYIMPVLASIFFRNSAKAVLATHRDVKYNMRYIKYNFFVSHIKQRVKKIKKFLHRIYKKRKKYERKRLTPWYDYYVVKRSNWRLTKKKTLRKEPIKELVFKSLGGVLSKHLFGNMYHEAFSNFFNPFLGNFLLIQNLYKNLTNFKKLRTVKRLFSLYKRQRQVAFFVNKITTKIRNSNFLIREFVPKYNSFMQERLKKIFFVLGEFLYYKEYFFIESLCRNVSVFFFNSLYLYFLLIFICYYIVLNYRNNYIFLYMLFSMNKGK